jgi:hypothetical protein
VLNSERKTLLSEMLGKVYGNKVIPERLRYGAGIDYDIWSIEYLSSNCDRDPEGKESPGQFDQGRVIIEHIRNLHSGKIPDSLPNLDPALKLPWNKPSGRKDLMLSKDDFNSFPYFLGEWDGKEWLVIV